MKSNKVKYAWNKKRKTVFRVLSWILRHPFSNHKTIAILDVGCNDGRFTDYYYKTALREMKKPFVVGLDIALKTPSVVVSQNIHFLKADARNLSLKDESFDLIISTEVIEHFIEGEQFIRECYRVLKPGGILLLTTPNRSRFTALPRSLISKIKGKRYVPGPTDEHLREYTSNELINILKNVGFNVILLDYIAFNPYLPLPDQFYFFLDKLADKSGLFGKMTKWDMIVVAEKKLNH
ncbi:Methyltransferase type 11 [Ferroglobus placidus DSM 10642]|uniref:Methyltransferase type 11 n=1 Tax=Ferroglobus placidus (strain DSM 10642 / AEDII12DO) TaxID=589924 RepID=D3S214_FERPA|nr:Methyltransferase type 11 [Ferroglobus placidus DSM 10642]